MSAVLSTHLFRTITAAHPDCVWEALTTSGEKVGWLYGLTVCGSWRDGSTVTAGVTGGPQLTGRVLRAEPPRLLSYSLGDTVDEPSAYLTWEICADPAGTVVRLYVDELDASAPIEVEIAWLPVLTALDRRLRHCGGDHHSFGDP
jgi:uncharacterized protein YndB with AHSA1/START domain